MWFNEPHFVQAQKSWNHLRLPSDVALTYSVLWGVTSWHFGQSLVRSPRMFPMKERGRG